MSLTKLYKVKVPIKGYYVITDIEATTEDHAKEIAVDCGPSESNHFWWQPVPDVEARESEDE